MNPIEHRRLIRKKALLKLLALYLLLWGIIILAIYLVP